MCQQRCGWVTDDPLYIAYHDNEWGVPVHDDRRWFEMLTLEGAQAGLSWITILKRQVGYRQAFDNFDVRKVAAYTDKDIARLKADTRIIRNTLKIQSALTNARAFIAVQDEFGSFDAYIWQFVDGQPIHNDWDTLADVPAQTSQSVAMSKALKKRGFKFVGPTICYALMQSCGMVNDHERGCCLYHGANTQ